MYRGYYRLVKPIGEQCPLYIKNLPQLSLTRRPAVADSDTSRPVSVSNLAVFKVEVEVQSYRLHW